MYLDTYDFSFCPISAIGGFTAQAIRTVMNQAFNLPLSTRAGISRVFAQVTNQSDTGFII